MGAVDISYPILFAFYGILILPLILSWVFKLNLTKKLLVGVVRMTIQLMLVGLYLEWIFKLNYWWLNCIWVMVMVFTAGGNAVKNAGLRWKFFLLPSLIGISLGIIGTGAILIALIKPEPFYDAAYLIPIMGMLLGNSMRGNILAMERFYYSINEGEKTYLTYLTLGATKKEALAPYLREALKPALTPTLSSMATLGIVSLPGMMTGQILGGSPPATAIKYQIAIMIAIFTAVTISALLTLLLSQIRAFNSYHMLKKDIFLKK